MTQATQSYYKGLSEPSCKSRWENPKASLKTRGNGSIFLTILVLELIYIFLQFRVRF